MGTIPLVLIDRSAPYRKDTKAFTVKVSSADLESCLDTFEYILNLRNLS